MDALKTSVWIRDPSEEWVPGTINAGIELPNNVELRNHSSSDDIDDMISLRHLNEPSILNAIHQRYNDDRIYTYTGKILIAVNPFKQIRVYGSKQITNYNEGKTDLPHVYHMSSKVYRMTGCNHSILVSGESGAGKTQTTKYIMKYIATVAPTMQYCNGLESRILQSNPLLEAFGNAKTRRNDNSSRFGKFIQIKMTKDLISGGQINTYLLEKIRLVSPPIDERNFHIFYQLLSGASVSMVERLHLTRDPANYKILSSSHCIVRNDGISDESEFSTTIEAMEEMGILRDETLHIMEVVSAILHLGNIDKCNAEWEIPSKLLGISENTLIEVCTRRHIYAGKDSYSIDLQNEEILESVKSIMRSLYDKLFNYIVQRINSTMVCDAPNFIGILDIFGFEVFDSNSFEQICINYTNESLQKIFTEFTIKSEQDHYQGEGIDWGNVSYPDNTSILDLIGGSGGIMALLDEQCLVPKGSSQFFFQEIVKRHSGNNLESSGIDRANSKFTINHYAGFVLYESDMFVEKNKDVPNKESFRVVSESTNCIISGFSIEKDESSSKITQTISKTFRRQLSDLITLIKNTHPHFIRCLKPNDENIPSKFIRKRVVDQLRYCGILAAVKVARSGYPIKIPIMTMKVDFGMLMNSCKKNNKNDKNDKNNKNECAMITDFMSTMGNWGSDYQVGKTRVFIKHHMYEKLERLRINCLGDNSSIIKSFVKRCFAHDAFSNIRYWAKYLSTMVRMSKDRHNHHSRIFGSMIIQSHIRKMNAKNTRHFLYENIQAGVIQSYIRADVPRFMFFIKKKSVIKIQAFCRCKTLMMDRGSVNLQDHKEMLKKIEMLEKENMNYRNCIKDDNKLSKEIQYLKGIVKNTNNKMDKIKKDSINVLMKSKMKDVEIIEQIRDENSEMADRINNLQRMLEKSRRQEHITRMKHPNEICSMM